MKPVTLDGKIVPHDDPTNPFKVVFSDGIEVLAEWPVDSRETGERRLESALRAIALRATESAQTDAEALEEQERLTR